MNSRQASWYLRMSEFIYYIHNRPRFKIDKPDGLSKGVGEEKSGMGAHVFDEVKLLDLKHDDVGEEENVKDMEKEGIDIATWKMENRLWIVLQEHRFEVLHQHCDSPVAGH